MPDATVVPLPPRPATGRPRVSVVIPTYNEARNLPHVFGLLPDDVHEVIVVDGRSVDDTIEVARALREDVVIVRQNRVGKGNAMACGFAVVTGDIVVMLDADGSADPREIERYVAALVAGADFAKGTRFADGGGSADITRLRAWGNRWLNRIANAFFGTRYTDLCYGYNAFWAHCLPALELRPGNRDSTEKLWGDGFEIETLINTRIAKAGLRITEVPSYEAERIHGQSNLNTWRDGLRVLRALLVERFNRKGRNVEIVRTEPRELAPVIPLPVRMHGNRVIQPVNAAPGTRLPDGHRTLHEVDEFAEFHTVDPGPLARALMAMAEADSR
jgi:glycosyltransferase involved in cell wall biosynthesis